MSLWFHVISGATHISFDPQTVNNRLALSDDLKTVTVTNKNIQYEKSERRFTTSQVLCLESFSSQCCYWEISTKDSHGWGVGAATADMARDGKLGRNNLSWCVEWSKDRLCAWHNNQDICVAIPRPLTIGVLLDLQEQKLTFYSISADSQILIHVYNLQRQGPIFPAVWLYGLTVGNSLTIRDIQRINMSHQ
uniref:B30.2/SPRY domain-containing protein n=1 Tax=Pyxicephalus adspersus TaxID=30357 RepID=A0AAV3A435_PYXAD|nr:TPA: hypothetical protein GDO54_012958 [Pyxicephalus adspersus]